MDIYTVKQRSAIMSRIRSTGTKPEERLYMVVRWVLGHRWQIDRNPSKILGSPDIYIPSLSLVLFVDGCFFHACPIHGHIPESNTDYWEQKIARNVRRYRRQLRKDGFGVWRFWEHELKPSRLEAAERRVLRAVARANGIR